MNLYKDFSVNLMEILKQESIKIDEPMKKHTSFKVGGAADILVEPESSEEVEKVIKLCTKNKIPYYVIGNGSNLIVKDGGIRGIVIKLSKLKNIKIDGERVIAESGITLAAMAQEALRNSLQGFEFASGIPGSVGGALNMNAGAYGGDMSQVVECAKVINDNGEVVSLCNEDLKLSYRKSIIMEKKYVVLEVTFKLAKGDQKEIKDKMDDLARRRKEKQPLEYPSAGSTFKRPEGHYASKLIEESGLKGVSVGDAEVSTKHSGFIINKGNATAKDVLDLIKVVQKTVKEKSDVQLNTEVLIIGED